MRPLLEAERLIVGGGEGGGRGRLLFSCADSVVV